MIAIDTFRSAQKAGRVIPFVLGLAPKFVANRALEGAGRGLQLFLVLVLSLAGMGVTALLNLMTMGPAKAGTACIGQKAAQTCFRKASIPACATS
jgi:hypothetical protein